MRGMKNGSFAMRCIGLGFNAAHMTSDISLNVSSSDFPCCWSTSYRAIAVRIWAMCLWLPLSQYSFSSSTRTDILARTSFLTSSSSVPK